VEPTAAPGSRWQLGYRPALDGLRGVAILAVVAWHVGVPNMDGAGQAGVTLFFALSGLLITSILVEEQARTGRIDFGRFYLRRATRLLPALLVLLAAASAFVLISRSGGGSVAILASLLYVANWAQASHVDLYPVQHMWTLAIEEQFYLAWPLLLLLLLTLRRRWALYAILAGIIASTALRYFFAPWAEDRALWGTDVRADALLAGCAIALLLTHRAVRVPGAVMAAAAIAFAVMLIIGTPPVLLAGGLTLLAVSSALLVLGAATMPITMPLAVLTWKPLCWVGSISYGLYLWHPFLFNAFPSVPHLVLVGPAVLVAAASSRWIEHPIVSWMKSGAPHRISEGREAPA
jgi:peptidoglycan/LPS O-acetylase OafA/YrhL